MNLVCASVQGCSLAKFVTHLARMRQVRLMKKRNPVTISHMSKPRINVQVSESQKQSYEQAAAKERIPLPVWIRKHLDIIAEEQLKSNKNK